MRENFKFIFQVCDDGEWASGSWYELPFRFSVVWTFGDGDVDDFA